MTSEDLYRVLLKAYPARYRHDYEEAMAQCFRDQLRAADTSGKRIRLWFRTVTDFALNVPARHLEMLRHLDLTMRRLRFDDGTELSFPWTPLVAIAQAVYARRSRHRNTFELQRAIGLARLEAKSLGGGVIGLEHLLLGTLRGDQKLATGLLGSHGLETMVRVLQTQPAVPPNALPHEQRLGHSHHLWRVGPRSLPRVPISLECKKVLREAWQEAQNSHANLSSHHLLLAILHQDTSLAARLLREYALDLSCLRPSSDLDTRGPKG